MIEIVYKENKEQANGNEGYFHLPKNIRQVGDTNGRERIYLEDYVGTFLKKYFSAPEGRAAMLFGEFKWADGISYFFIRSAAAIHTMEPAPDHLVFDDAVWTEVHDVMEKYFKNQQILGWALSLPGYGEDLNEQIIRAHLNHFGGNDKTLFRVNGQEKEETFYTYEGGTLRSTGGFYIYYEKNEPMQSYLIDQNQNRSIENGESVPDRAVSAADASAALSAVCVFSPCTFPATATVCSFVFPGNGSASPYFCVTVTRSAAAAHAVIA